MMPFIAPETCPPPSLRKRRRFCSQRFFQRQRQASSHRPRPDLILYVKYTTVDDIRAAGDTFPYQLRHLANRTIPSICLLTKFTMLLTTASIGILERTGCKGIVELSLASNPTRSCFCIKSKRPRLAKGLNTVREYGGTQMGKTRKINTTGSGTYLF